MARHSMRPQVYSRLAITELLIEALDGFDLSWPPPDFDVEAEKKRLKDA